jgi:hypothetical protein
MGALWRAVLAQPALAATLGVLAVAVIRSERRRMRREDLERDFSPDLVAAILSTGADARAARRFARRRAIKHALRRWAIAVHRCALGRVAALRTSLRRDR